MSNHYKEKYIKYKNKYNNLYNEQNGGSNLISESPNFGGVKINLLAKDDAENVHLVNVLDIANGKKAMPFVHPFFLYNYYNNNPKSTLTNKLRLITDLATVRNIRLMRKINKILQIKQKIQFTITKEMESIENSLPELIRQSKNFPEMNTQIYLDESTDQDDINECTNSWNLNQSATPGKAADSIKIFRDFDNNDWLVLISRKNGPGRNQYAYAGGFVDPGETFIAAAAREADEETSVKLSGSINCETRITNIPEKLRLYWDPRAKYPFGMINGATVTHYFCTR